ncbi:UvrD-like helicase, ATP-binding domain [Sesbania bispinosa]|nr:UvrD-like helicase, ATP-binding domain [Sesbania bispinosa]
MSMNYLVPLRMTYNGQPVTTMTMSNIGVSRDDTNKVWCEGLELRGISHFQFMTFTTIKFNVFVSHYACRCPLIVVNMWNPSFMVVKVRNMSIENKKPCNASEVHYMLQRLGIPTSWAPSTPLPSGPTMSSHDSSAALKLKPTSLIPLRATLTTTTKARARAVTPLSPPYQSMTSRVVLSSLWIASRCSPIWGDEGGGRCREMVEKRNRERKIICQYPIYIFNEDLYKDKVKHIDLSFRSVDHYFGSYVYPLLDETRAQICSSMEILSNAPFAEVISIELARSYSWSSRRTLYNVKTDSWKNRMGKMWSFVLSAGIVQEENEDEDAELMSTFKVIASKDIDLNEVEDSCDYCSLNNDDRTFQKLSSELNESQYKAISACLSSFQCNHKSTMDLIWGPPGTGKTKTLGTLLFALLKMNCRTLVCAPTNVAIKEVASRVLSMVRASFDRKSDALFCSLGDMLLFGNHERLKVGTDIEDIYLDYRIKQLSMCFTPPTGWRYCFGSMIDLLENCVSHYHIFIENELRKEQDQIDENNTNRTKDDNPSDCSVKKCKSFLEFVRERFLAIALPLRDCISVLCTHIARSYIMEHNFEDLVCLVRSLDSFEALLFQSNIVCEVLEEIFSPSEGQHSSFESYVDAEYLLYKSRNECLSSLRILKDSLGELNLPDFMTKESIREFCLQTSSLIFSTASSSFKLHSVSMEPLNILVIDEAAQLKECESIIPLQLPDIKHAILVGDVCQLPAMVESNYFLHVRIFSSSNIVPAFAWYAAWLDSKENLSIGIVSPYAAQVVAIQDILGQKYDGHDGFDVKVKTIDGFQGGEQDIIILSTDIIKESRYTQVLKIWDILPPEDIPKIVKRLDSIFGSYTDDFISRCSEQCFEGNMEVPMSWEKSIEIIKFKNIDNNVNEAELSGCDQRIYVENSKVEESLLLMKFYSLSSVVVSHLLSYSNSSELDLPFEVSDEEHDIIFFSRSTFVLGRSGTGKTTVLTMKLFQNEKSHHMALEETYGLKSAAVPCLNYDKEYKESSAVNDRPVLHQLFVTVSPKLCQAVKYHVARLKRFICGGNISAESSSFEEDIDVDTSMQFKNIPDSFMNLPTNSYPLVITFQKFLMMLDGTVGNSFFERFSDLSSHGQNCGVSSVALETFIRKREVTYDRFDSLYWPHFNSQHIKKLDSSRVFTEIISHIKGGMQAVEHGEGRLSREDYLSLSENRASSLSRQKREIIYDIFQGYEKMKMDKGDFDLADIVADLHRRLKIKRYEGDEMHFVYIDEVQDLTLSQIALFKYVCQNVEEGFVFCGDTAQTIARGIDFRFQDIRSLFYKKFVLESKRSSYNQGKEKGKISEIFLLNQNFRTHAGVLKLSQSTIELLFRFFPHSVDVLKPETSLIYGEAPVVLECGNRKNAIVTIFGNSGHVGGKIVGFGAEQDVLLYNFFGSSPLKNRWRVIYEYMNEQDMLEPTESRQRLWICENAEEFCKPMFDYWKKKCLVQFKELDDSLAQAMKVASSPEEWKSRGKKLYYQNNYEMATMCFERAGDSYWEKKSKAAGLRATANRLRDLNPEDANAILREAAEIFESIGMADSAAQCFSDLGDHERAGVKHSFSIALRFIPHCMSFVDCLSLQQYHTSMAMFWKLNRLGELVRKIGCDYVTDNWKLYLEKCEEPDLKRAGDCFYLAGCYKVASQVYARGNFFAECLTVCAEGRLFDIGLSYIQHWKQNGNADHDMVKSHDLYTIEQKFLESCARNYFDDKDTRSMMKFVRAFHSMDFKREFLKSLNLMDELLMLEEESGNFMEAVNIAKMMGDLLREADLLGKAGKFMEAYEVVLFYVLANSLWSEGSKGRPLKHFAQKAGLLERALSFAKEVSSSFYEVASIEAEILSNEHSNIFEIWVHLKSSHKYKSVRGEILCLWKLLDAHFQLNSSKYVWQDHVFADFVEGMILKNQLSVETLFYCWTCWKDNIVHILEYLSSFKFQGIHQHNSYGEFALNYLGVQKQICNANDIYLLLIPDANWVTKLGDRFLKKDGKLVSVDVQPLVSSAQSYWSSELFSVGMDVLHNLDALFKFSVNKHLSEFCQFQSLLHMYEVSKFLLESKCFSHSHGNLKTLEKFRKPPIDSLFCYIVPLDWKKSLTKDMVFLRATEVCQDLVKEAIYENIKRKDRLTYGQIGRVVVMILGTANMKNELFVEVMTRFEDNTPWKEFIQSLLGKSAQEMSQGNEAITELHSMFKFYEALQYTYSVNWIKELDYISPSCFMYLIERLLLLTSCRKGFIFASKSSFIEWLIYQDENSFPNLSMIDNVQSVIEDVHKFIAHVLREFVYDQNGIKNWIRKSNLDVKNYFPLFVLRLVVSICLLHLSSGKHLDLLHYFLGKSHLTTQLPSEFRNILQKGRKHLGLIVFAEAFKMIDNPLVIVRLWNNSTEIVCPDAVFVDLTICRQRELILQTLFPDRVEGGETAAVEVEASDSPSKEFPSTNSSGLPNKSCAPVSGQNTNVENEPPPQASSNDSQLGQNVLEAKDNRSQNSQGANNSGHENIKKDNIKGNKNKPKKSRWKKKGRK